MTQLICESGFQYMKRKYCIEGVIINSCKKKEKETISFLKHDSKTRHTSQKKKISGFVGWWFSNVRICCFSVRYGQLVWRKTLLEDANFGLCALV